MQFIATDVAMVWSVCAELGTQACCAKMDKLIVCRFGEQVMLAQETIIKWGSKFTKGHF